MKWKDNSIVLLSSNFVGIEPVDSFQPCDRTENCKRDIYYKMVFKGVLASPSHVFFEDNSLLLLYNICRISFLHNTF